MAGLGDYLKPSSNHAENLAYLLHRQSLRNGGLASLLGQVAAEKPRTYPCFVAYQDKKGEWRWELKASNHLTLEVSSEGYHNRKDAEHAIGLIRKAAATAPLYFD